MIVIVCGLPGSGKSYFATRLSAALHARYISSDDIRFRMFPERTYSDAEKTQVYAAMLSAMNDAIAGNQAVVLDATFSREAWRRMFEDAAATRQQALVYIEVVAPDPLVRERLRQPRTSSEADYAVYRKVKDEAEPLLRDHLVLTSSNDNIDSMLAEALTYIHARA